MKGNGFIESCTDVLLTGLCEKNRAAALKLCPLTCQLCGSTPKNQEKATQAKKTSEATQAKETAKSFHMIDLDKNGDITKQELVEALGTGHAEQLKGALQNEGKRADDTATIGKLRNSADTNKDGKLDMKEYEALLDKVERENLPDAKTPAKKKVAPKTELSNKLTKEEKDNFKKIDESANGEISSGELTDAVNVREAGELQDMLDKEGGDPDNAAIKKLLDFGDTNKDGTLNSEEYKTLVDKAKKGESLPREPAKAPEKKPTEEEKEKQKKLDEFGKIDADQNGAVNKQELIDAVNLGEAGDLQDVLDKQGGDVDDAAIEKLIKSGDANQDGNLDAKEYKALLDKDQENAATPNAFVQNTELTSHKLTTVANQPVKRATATAISKASTAVDLKSAATKKVQLHATSHKAGTSRVRARAAYKHSLAAFAHRGRVVKPKPVRGTSCSTFSYCPHDMVINAFAECKLGFCDIDTCCVDERSLPAT
eukprot:CAMPEP_0197631796 /NCGR_PEP_ID=MMETSP1338-20131121/8844_1 /TAXON_ID=43686 ORGANISM="Pelagodinium beii, Strain RCC1491" /NCGR_SAMPLE_ID=MMETSP1338 /ASSEMBLY_ACC=CAM_ASM_000754 /LENGTH=482 /DNA_ID=CAMNT_0043203329 /DNA_START=415 /DNA_END=1863 /DNA_ORIENTATION=+